MTLVRWVTGILVSLTLACSDVIPLPELQPEQLLVANALFSPDTTWQVQLTTTAPLNRLKEISPITNGVITVKDVERNSTLTLQHQQEGWYTSSQERPIATTNYQLSVQVDGYNSLQAIDQIPQAFKASIEQYDTVTYRNVLGYNFGLRIEDNPTAANYYLITITYIIERDGYVYTIPTGHFSLDNNSDNEDIELDHDRLTKSYLRDVNFNGQAYLTSVIGTDTLLNYFNELDKIKAIIQVKSISEVGYEYEKSIEIFRLSGDDIFIEPIRIFSNVDNGLGIFAGYVEQRLEVRLK